MSPLRCVQPMNAPARTGWKQRGTHVPPTTPMCASNVTVAFLSIRITVFKTVVRVRTDKQMQAMRARQTPPIVVPHVIQDTIGTDHHDRASKTSVSADLGRRAVATPISPKRVTRSCATSDIRVRWDWILTSAYRTNAHALMA